jgi:pimeloyl-ACP methyl ester carboxylesterase
MFYWTLSMYHRLIVSGVFLFLTVGCSSLGKLTPSNTLAMDAVNMPSGDLAGLGPQQIISTRMMIDHQGEELPIALYQPANAPANSPAIVFLPGLMAPDDQYESYARALASRGFVVAVRGWYSLFTTDIELAHDANVIADWLVSTQGVNPKKIGIAGHSMGGKDAMLAASRYGVFASVVAIDPDDNGKLSVAHGGLIALMRAPLLLIGAEVAWQASSICAPKENNYQRFFEQASLGTVELTLKNADHVQMLDEPDSFGYGICRCGTADSRQVRITARRATVGFFVQHLMNGPELAKPLQNNGLIRVAQNNPVMIR